VDDVYRFLLTPRWWGINVFVLLAIPFCLFMGSWQLSRFESRVDGHREAKAQAASARTEAARPLAGGKAARAYGFALEYGAVFEYEDCGLGHWARLGVKEPCPLTCGCKKPRTRYFSGPWRWESGERELYGRGLPGASRFFKDRAEAARAGA
jgi:hypothetical protein